MKVKLLSCQNQTIQLINLQSAPKHKFQIKWPLGKEQLTILENLHAVMIALKSFIVDQLYIMQKNKTLRDISAL